VNFAFFDQATFNFSYKFIWQKPALNLASIHPIRLIKMCTVPDETESTPNTQRWTEKLHWLSTLLALSFSFTFVSVRLEPSARTEYLSQYIVY